MAGAKGQADVRQGFQKALESIVNSRTKIEQVLASDPKETREAFQRLSEAALAVHETLQSPVNFATIFDSTSLILALSRDALGIIERQPARQLLESIVEQSNTLEKSSIRLLEQGETLQRTFEYYRTLTDVEVVSHELLQMGRILGQKSSRSLLETLKKYIESIANFFREIGRRLKAVVLRWDQELLSALRDLQGVLKESINKVADKFRVLVDKFHSFTIYLIRRTFDFLGEISKIAKERKFSLDEITLEVPSYEFEIALVGGAPIPIPRVKSPKLVIKFKPITET